MKKTLLILAFFALTGLASASVTYTVTGTYTSGTGTSGADMTIVGGGDTFTLDWSDSSPTNTVSASFSNINYGEFTLACTAGCDGTAVTVPAFTFQITVNDTTDSGIGVYTATYLGGATVSYNSTSHIGSSSVDVTWAPTQLGSGTNNASSGTFLLTEFTIDSPTPIVDPSTNAGVSTIQGTFQELSGAPEPATMGMVGGALLGLGLLRKKFAR